MIEKPAKHPLYTTYTLEEAIALLPDGPLIDTRYETVPNCGITKCAEAPREQIIALLREAAEHGYLFESGSQGIKLGFAIHFEVKNYKDGSRGNLFVQTRNKN